MTKLEFMKELESLLLDVPLEERDEALQYYNGYFDDAGEDQEEDIIKELGSPTKVASIIKADLNPDATGRESRGYFTEKGYQETIKNEYEIVGAEKKDAGNNSQTNNANEANSTSQTNNAYYNRYASGNTNNSSENGANSNANYTNGNTNYTNGNKNYTNSNAGQSTYKNTQHKNNANTGLIAVLAIFTFPIWLPLLLSAFGIFIGVVATILGLIFGFGVAGITMIGVGVALFIAGLVQISVPFVGLVLIGSGLIIFGIGILLTLACIALCKNVLPAMFKGIVELCRLPFKNRSVMA